MKLLLPLLLAALITACGSGADADEDEPVPENIDTFPHAEGAEQIDAAYIDELPFDLAYSDAIATLHLVDAEPMYLSSYYAADFMHEIDGWTGSTIAANSQYAHYTMYEKGSRVAVLTITGTKVLLETSEAAAEIDFSPFDEINRDLINDQTLILTRFFTCDEASVDVCWQAVFDEYWPGLRSNWRR